MAEAAAVEVPVLPDLVLLQVLALLPLRDRLRAARVCRRWQQLVQDPMVWRYVDLSPHRLCSHSLWHLVRRHLGDSLRTLRMRGTLCSVSKRRLLSPALLAALSKRCPRLHRLSLAETDLRHVPYESIPLSLTVLELSRCEIPTAWFLASAAPRLRHLIVHNTPGFFDHHLLNVSSQNRLKTLSLCGTYRLTDTGIQKAAPHLEELERLVLRHCSFGDAAISFIVRHAKHLRFLEMSDTDSLTDVGLACLATLQHLQALCLHLCDKISPGAVTALCQALPQLRNLKLTFEKEEIDKIRAILPHCSVSHAP
ncbi:F-box/LRR-repeat protein 12 [Falco naumanni]|uniref:F-box/LRR-repeat protein 12 n=1 Tax=Falco naumanni TaxID=148594 RepID=UPI001ADE823D|nr:F-box/LRR-repeat protein 12 [Falco naumanni]